MLRNFSPTEVGRSAGYARSAHGWRHDAPELLQLRNNPERLYVGTNTNGNRVAVFWRDGDVLITDAADTQALISAYGRSAPLRPSYVRDKWAGNTNYRLITGSVGRSPPGPESYLQILQRWWGGKSR